MVSRSLSLCHRRAKCCGCARDLRPCLQDATSTPGTEETVDTKEDDPSVPVITIVLAAAAVCCCPIILALLLRARGKTTFVLTFDGANSYDLVPEEVAELQAQAIKVVVAHSRRGANGGQQGGLEAADEAQQKPRIEEDDVNESYVLNEDEGAAEQGADTLGPEDQQVLVVVSFRSTVSSDGLELTFKNLLGAAAAGRGDGCGIDEPAKAQAAGLPVTVAVGSKSLTLVLASKGQPPKKNKPAKALPLYEQGAAEVVAFENPAFAGPDDGKAAVEAEAEASDGGYLHVDATAPTADDTPNETAAALAAPAAPTSGPAVPAAEDTEESGFGFGAAAGGDSAEIDAEIEAADDGAGFTF